MNDGVMSMLTNWDRHAFAEINHGIKTPILDVIMPRISDLGLGHVQVLFVLGCAVLAAALAGQIHFRSLLRDIQVAVVRRKSWVLPLLLAFALSGIAATAFKHSVDRDRPWWFYHNEHLAGRDLDVRVETVSGRRPVRVRGFLSGHTATSVALATAGTLLFKRRRDFRGLIASGWILAALISLSRIYIADHWPLDVVCGIALGIVSGFAAVKICEKRPASSSDSGLQKEESIGAINKSAAT